MTLEEQYHTMYDSYALTYLEYVRALAYGTEAEVVMLTEAYEQASKEFLELREEATGRSDLPNIKIFIRSDGQFNSFAESFYKGLLSADGLIAESERFDMEEFLRIGGVIRRYIDTIYVPVQPEEPGEEPEPEDKPEPEPQPEEESADKAEESEGEKSESLWKRIRGLFFERRLNE